MTANEIRIGNLVKSKLLGTEHKVLGVYKNKIWTDLQESWSDIEDFEPIPITEERLLRFGFENKEFSFDKGSFFLMKRKSKKEYLYQAHTNRFQVKYVHQLQNLFYSLKNQELCIK
jgi:hypothetical protein